MSFDSLGLSAPILEAVADQGYDTPTPVQSQSIPAILQGHDVMAAAQTGTGKTAGFTLPLLERLLKGRRPQANQVRALVLTPTRELAAQVSDSLDKYSVNVPIRSTVVFGGVKINPQMMKLRKGVDVLVATPGRLLDLHTKNALSLDQLEILVLDEADRMLDMGFIHDIRKIIALVPARRQNLLFSATFSKEIRALAKGLIHDPVEISVSPENATAKTVEQQVIPVDKSKKAALLIHLVKERGWYQVLVFCRTKHGANKLAYQLNKAEITAAPIHGNKSQGARTRALAEFKNGELQVLVATDIAARGLDIDQLPQVVNFDLPHVAEDYVHRIGRTGRAGSEGKAFSLVCAEESKELAGIERFIQEVIPRRGEPGFTPKDKLPESPSKLKPLKPKKPKKPKKNKAPSNEGVKSKGDRRERQVERSPENERRPQESTPRHKGAGNADAPRKRKPGSAGRGNPKQGTDKQSSDKQRSNQQGKSGQRQRSQSKSQPNSQSFRRDRQDRQGRPEKQGGSNSQSQTNGRNKPKASGAQPKRSPRKRPAKNSPGNA